MTRALVALLLAACASSADPAPELADASAPDAKHPWSEPSDDGPAQGCAARNLPCRPYNQITDLPRPQP